MSDAQANVYIYVKPETSLNLVLGGCRKFCK